MDSFFISSDSSSDIFGIPDVDGDSVSVPGIPSIRPSQCMISDDVQFVGNWRITRLDTVLGRRVITINVPRNPTPGAHPVLGNIDFLKALDLVIFVDDIRLVSSRPRGFTVPVGAYDSSHFNYGKIDPARGLFFRMGDQRDLYAGNDLKITWRDLIRILNPRCPDSGFVLHPFGSQGGNHQRASFWYQDITVHRNSPPACSGSRFGFGRRVRRGGVLPS